MLKLAACTLLILQWIVYGGAYMDQSVSTSSRIISPSSTVAASTSHRSSSTKLITIFPTPTETGNGPTTSGISIIIFIAVLFSIIMAIVGTMGIVTLLTCICSRRVEVPTVRNDPRAPAMYDTQDEQIDDDNDDDGDDDDDDDDDDDYV
uniref:Syndecan/Neurexin domain-containing protein n=1 Tax=Amphimedon queenslandica TaxID=400682 RepID=A0A1X7U4F2_AMPQE